MIHCNDEINFHLQISYVSPDILTLGTVSKCKHCVTKYYFGLVDL